jgi:hypothetical protein
MLVTAKPLLNGAVLTRPTKYFANSLALKGSVGVSSSVSRSSQFNYLPSKVSERLNGADAEDTNTGATAHNCADKDSPTNQLVMTHFLNP